MFDTLLLSELFVTRYLPTVLFGTSFPSTRLKKRNHSVEMDKVLWMSPKEVANWVKKCRNRRLQL